MTHARTGPTLVDEGLSLRIVADDLTGACDVAGALAACGLPGYVALHELAGERPDVPVLVADADARDAAPNAVASGLRRALERLGCEASDLTMLKVDSGLRGAIPDYLRFLSDAAAGAPGCAVSPRPVVLAPAFPERGRTIDGGRLWRAGRDCDPGGAFLRALRGRVGAEHVNLALVRASGAAPRRRAPLAPRRAPRRARNATRPVSAGAGEALAHVLEVAFARGTQVALCDAVTPDDLRAIASAWAPHRERWLLAGSAGIARHAGALLAGREATTTPAPPVGARVLVVVGSPEAASRAQIEALLHEPGVRPVDTEAEPPHRDRGIVVLVTAEPQIVATGTSRDGGNKAAELAERCAGLATHYRPDALILVGGATARAVSDRLAVRGLHIAGEYAEGVPFGALVGGPWDGVPVWTKSGAFGDAGLLARLATALLGDTGSAHGKELHRYGA